MAFMFGYDANAMYGNNPQDLPIRIGPQVGDVALQAATRQSRARLRPAFVDKR